MLVAQFDYLQRSPNHVVLKVSNKYGQTLLIVMCGLPKTVQTHERELSSIRPINGSGGQGAGGQGSIVDKASARDLLRADVSPMEIDPNITFDSIGGGKVCQGDILHLGVGGRVVKVRTRTDGSYGMLDGFEASLLSMNSVSYFAEARPDA